MNKEELTKAVSTYLQEKFWNPTETAKNFPNMIEFEKNFENCQIIISYKHDYIIVWIEEDDTEIQFSIKPKSFQEAMQIIDISSTINKQNIQARLEQLSNISEVFLGEED